MPTDAAPPGALRYLREQDLDLLLSLGHRRSFSAGDTLTVRGERLEELLILEEGELEVHPAEGAPRALAPGEVFGGSALAVSRPAEETVRAGGDLVAIVLSRSALEQLAADQPETAARLALGLAAQLALGVEGGTAGEAAPAEGRPAAGRSESPAVAEVRAAVRAAERSLRSLARGAEGETPSAARDLPAVAALDRIVAAIERAANRSGRDAGEAVEAARAELAPLIEKSRLAKRMNERAPEEPARYRALDHIYRNQPEGEDAAGVLLDAYLLDRPFAHTLRERRRIFSELLNEEVRRRARPGEVARVLSLGCGPARAIADVLAQPGMAELISLTCVDDDQEAIVFANNLLRGRAPTADLTLHQIPPSDLSYSESGFSGADIAASLFVADHLETDALAAAIRQTYQSLRPGGVLLLGAFREDGADRWITNLFLNWRPARHHPEALERALGGSLGDRVSIAVSPDGGNLIVRAVKE